MVSQVTTLDVPDACGRGRLKMTWIECVKQDFHTHKLDRKK